MIDVILLCTFVLTPRTLSFLSGGARNLPFRAAPGFRSMRNHLWWGGLERPEPVRDSGRPLRRPRVQGRRPVPRASSSFQGSGPRLTANRKQQKALLSLLRQLRTDAGRRLVDMAKALGKPQAFVSYYESGARRLDLLELRQICGILGIPLTEFVRKFEKSLR